MIAGDNIYQAIVNLKLSIEVYIESTRPGLYGELFR